MKQIRKTKIICTLGPSTDKEGVLRQLIEAGMDVARFNFSHGSHEEQLGRLERLREIREELNVPVAALMDTKGPEIRLKEFEKGKVRLEVGQDFVLTTREVVGDEHQVSITYRDLPKDVKKGDHILIDDGLIEMQVQNVTDTDITCKVMNGGPVSNKKGVNVPNVELSMPYISSKDYKDIIFAVKENFDFIAASFVRSAADVEELRGILKDHGGEHIQIIAKIENNQGIANVDEIIKVSDGIMVARGDMGVEIPLEDVPVIQKQIIKKVYNAGKIVITATQMLDSMMSHPRPTRAEATDVANAIYDGTSGIMLSGRGLPGGGRAGYGADCPSDGGGYSLSDAASEPETGGKDEHYGRDFPFRLPDGGGSGRGGHRHGQQIRQNGPHDFQVSSALPHYRRLSFQICVASAEHVLGNHAPADRREGQFGGAL